MTSQPPQHPGLADELLARMAEDQRLRGLPGHAWTDEVLAEIQAIDEDNTAALKRIVAEHGWPGHTLVGEEAATAAWLIAQHATDDREFQERARVLLAAAVATGDADPAHLAYLTDRCLVFEDKPQIYGTQYTRPPGEELRPAPIEDPANLDVRRARVGLGPHAEYDAALRRRELS